MYMKQCVQGACKKKASLVEEKRLAAGGEKPEESELQVSEGEAVRADPGVLKWLPNDTT